MTFLFYNCYWLLLLCIMKYAIELPLLLLFFAFMLSGPVSTNLMLYRTCYVILGYNKSDCALLGTVKNNITQYLETEVEPTVNVINTVKSSIESVTTIVVLIFMGPWSDRFGRKPVIISCLIGFAASAALTIPFSYFDVSPWYWLICSIPMILTGGAPTFTTVVLSYIADVTTDANRGMRMVIFDAVLAVGSLVGNLSSSYIFYATNYESIYAIMTLSIFLSLLWVIFFVPESVTSVETEGKLRGFFNLSNLVDTIQTTIRPRENYQRSIIMLCIAAFTLFMFAVTGDGLTFMYLRDKFEWTLTKYTFYSSASLVIGIAGALLGVVLLRKILKLPESVTILLGSMCMCNGAILAGLANSDNVIYSATGIKALGGVISPMIKSLVAKLASPEEVGKIFSVIMLSQYLVGLGANPLYTFVYNSTITTNPGIFNYLSAGIFGTNVIIMMIVVALQCRTLVPYGMLEENSAVQAEEDLTIN